MTWGEGEVWLTRICRGLAARGHDIAVACQPGSKLSERLGTVPIHGFDVRMSDDFNFPGTLPNRSGYTTAASGAR